MNRYFRFYTIEAMFKNYPSEPTGMFMVEGDQAFYQIARRHSWLKTTKHYLLLLQLETIPQAAYETDLVFDVLPVFTPIYYHPMSLSLGDADTCRIKLDSAA
jgi:hypothetical protein